MQSIFSKFGSTVLSSFFGHFRSSVGTPVLVPCAHPVINGLHATQVRGIMRKFFARPSNTIRIKRYGYQARLKTKGGRLVLMKRLLKGRHCLSH